MEAFSDGVFAVIITIMVLEMKSPHGTDLAALQSLLPVFFSYVLSFVYVGIYWNNHHHLLQAAKHVTGGILWANLHVLFWLSPTPFVTAWMGENHFAPWPVARTTRFYQTTAALQPRILCFGFFSALASFLLWLLFCFGFFQDWDVGVGVFPDRVAVHLWLLPVWRPSVQKRRIHCTPMNGESGLLRVGFARCTSK